MATKSPTQMHNQWPNVSGPTELPNVSGATIQDSAVEVGDQCYSISDTTTYQCTTATVGSAVWSSMGGSSTDADAIHDNVSAEISAIAAKATPTTSDYLVIEDAAAADAKKSITIGDLPAAAPAAHDLGGSLHNSATLAQLNAKVSDATLDDSSSTRPPAAHDLAGADHNSATLAQLNAKVSDATLDDSSSTRDPNAHTLGGSAHSADTLANLNAKISDATLDDSSDPRTDSNAIHTTGSSEIGGLTEKVSPVGADVLVIEDSAATFAKKKVQITNLPGGADADAIHDNVAGEIAAIAAKATPTTSDYLVIEDAAATNAKKSITIGDLPAATPASHALGGSEHSSSTLAQLNALVSDATLDDSSDPRTDSTAIHTDGSAEISGLTEKASPVGADVLVIEDSAAANVKKKVQITNLPGGADADAIHDNVAGEIVLVTEKATPVSADLLLIEDSADSNNKKRVQVGNLPGGSGTDADAIHDNVSGEIAAITAKATPVDADYLVIEDSAATNAKKSITIGDLPAAAHIASTSNPHTVTAAQVGNTTAQWNADQLQGGDVDAALAPTDGQVLTYDGTGAQWTAASPAEGTSYLQMGENHTLTSAGGSPDTEDVGRGVFDASQHNAITFRAVVNSVYATTGTADVKLYDDGTPSTPGTPRLVTTFTHTDDTVTYEAFEQALTVVASGAGTNEILGAERVYRVVVEITATSSDTIRVSTAGFAAVGNGDVVTLSADAVQAIAMSLNA